MLQTAWEHVQSWMGLRRDIEDVGPLQMALRTLAIYAFTLALIRLGSKRFLAQATAFDVVVGIMLGSVMSRAINGSAPFVPTLLAGAGLVGLHWLLGVLAYHADWFGPLVKGEPVLLIEDGVVQREGMQRSGLSRHDLDQALRLQARQTDPAGVRLAYLERNGGISVIPKEHGPRVVDVTVERGVQTVRIELD